MSVLGLAVRCLERIAALDRRGPVLNAVPTLDPAVLDEARRLDAELRAGAVRGPLHGIPFTVKDSFSVAGLSMAAGSPAFADRVARKDATVVARLRAAGALLIGRTTMPPMAIGGGQAGLNGRVRSPFNSEYVAAAWHSGSSIGSGVAVAADLCVFGVGEETVSSGRSPASNNGLVAWTPSWGVVPSHGNWPLHPYRDTVVPHARSVADLRTLARVLAGADSDDVWHQQVAVDISAAAEVVAGLADTETTTPLRGLRVGVPSLYVGERRNGVEPLRLRRSIKRRWDIVEDTLRARGAQVVHVPFPAVEIYEGRRPGSTGLSDSGYLPAGWDAYELHELVRHAWDRHLADFATDPSGVEHVVPWAIRPDPPNTIDALSIGGSAANRDSFDYAGIVTMAPPDPDTVRARVAPAVEGLDLARREFHDAWLDEQGLDALIFPANGDIGAYDSDINASSARTAWADGSVFSHGNHVLRRLGIPTVTVPMGLMDDTQMPVGCTLAGRGWDDVLLLQVAGELEQALAAASRPPLPGLGEASPACQSPAAMTLLCSATINDFGDVEILVEVTVDAPSDTTTSVRVGDVVLPVTTPQGVVRTVVPGERRRRDGVTSVLVIGQVRKPDGSILTATFHEVPYVRPDSLVDPVDVS